MLRRDGAAAAVTAASVMNDVVVFIVFLDGAAVAASCMWRRAAFSARQVKQSNLGHQKHLELEGYLLKRK